MYLAANARLLVKKFITGFFTAILRNTVRCWADRIHTVLYCGLRFMDDLVVKGDGAAPSPQWSQSLQDIYNAAAGLVLHFFIAFFVGRGSPLCPITLLLSFRLQPLGTEPIPFKLVLSTFVSAPQWKGAIRTVVVSVFF